MNVTRIAATIAGVFASLVISTGTAHAGTYYPDMPGCVSAANGTPGEDVTVQFCDQYRLADDDTPDRVADCLVALGYHGRSDDHASVIYSTWQDIEWCASDPAGMFAYAVPVTATTV